MITTATHKICARCYGIKQHKEFSKRARSKDGMRSWCKGCDYDYRINKTKDKDLKRVRTHKVCRFCKEIKLLDEFYKDIQGVIGRKAWCRKCMQGYDRSYARYIKRFYSIAESKTCSVCKVEKPRSEFHLSARVFDRLQNKCKPCRSAYAKMLRRKKRELTA